MTWSFMTENVSSVAQFLFVWVINGLQWGLIDKFGTEAAMFKGKVVMILIWNTAPIISNINNHQLGFVIISWRRLEVGQG